MRYILLIWSVLIIIISCKKKINDRFDEIKASSNTYVTNEIDSNQLILQKIRDIYDLNNMRHDADIDSQMKQEIDSTLAKMFLGKDSLNLFQAATLDSLEVVHYKEIDSITSEKIVKFKENNTPKYAKLKVLKEKLLIEGKTVENIQIKFYKIFDSVQTDTLKKNP